MKVSSVLAMSILTSMLFMVSCSKDDETTETGGKIKGHDYVDLGLSVKWATCNVGAKSPEDAGEYYAWGEVNTKNEYSMENYSYYVGYDDDHLASPYVFEDIGKNIAGTQYDVAHVKWGGKWRMPLSSEFRELIDKCSWTFTQRNGMPGALVTGPNGNSIFLPAAGSRDNSDLDDGEGLYGFYWSSTLRSIYTGDVYYLRFSSGNHDVDDGYRYRGRTVRPVSE